MGRNQLNQCYVSFRGQTADKDGHCQQSAGLQNSLTKNFHSGVKGSQDRCQDNYYQIRVKPPIFCVGYNNDRKREYVCAM